MDENIDTKPTEPDDDVTQLVVIGCSVADPFMIGVGYECSHTEALQYLTRASKIVRTSINAARKQRSGLIVPEHLRR